MKWDWNCVKGVFWTTLVLGALFVVFWWWTPIRMTVWPCKYDCRFTYDQRYEIYTDQWRTIPLGIGPDGEEGIWLSHGKPWTTKDIDVTKVKLKYFRQVRDGNYVVIYRSGTGEFTSVWSNELLQRWQYIHPQHFRRVKFDSEHGCPYSWAEER